MIAATITTVDGKVPLVVDLDGTLVRSDLFSGSSAPPRR
jgi:hypothetical protein